MARGGYRPGAGRPRKGTLPLPEEVRRGAKKAGMTPKEYMLAVMNNPEADETRRDRMAIAVAPYCHARASEAPAGKKEQAQAAAETAGDGTGWGDDLAAPGSRPN